MVGPGFPAVLVVAQGGDERGFAVLWRELQPAVLRYFQVVAQEMAEDLAADTWGSIIGGLGRFRGDERGLPGLDLHTGPPPGHRLAPAGRAMADQLGPR
jgi:hypothetical protein